MPNATIEQAPAAPSPNAEASQVPPPAAPAQAAPAPAAPAAQAPPPADGAQPPQESTTTTRSWETILAKGDLAEISALMRDPNAIAELGEFPTDEAPQPEGTPAPTPGEQPTSPQEAPAGQQPPPPAAEDEEGRRPERIRLTSYSPEDQDLITSAHKLAREQKIGFSEAFRRVSIPSTATPPAGAPAATPGAPAPAAPAPAPTAIEQAQARIATLKTELKSAFEGFDTDKQVDITDQLTETRAELMRLQSEQAQADRSQTLTAEQQWKAREAETFTKVETKFPDLQTKDSPLNKAVQARIAELEKANPDFFNDPSWLNLVTSEQAMELGIAPVTAAKAPAAAPAAAPAPPKPSSPPPVQKVVPRQSGHPAAVPPAPGSAGAAQPPGLTTADTERLAGSSNLGVLLGALNAGGTRGPRRA